jgi:SAM-dependent methyltransferase
MKCKFCNSNNTFFVNSFKNYWLYCGGCKNQKSFSKNKKTIFNYVSFIFYIFDKIFKTTLRNTLCYYNKSPQDQYFYYFDVIKNHRYEETKWFNYDKLFIDFLDNNNIVLYDKKLISISEEPGYFYKLIKNKCSKVLFTALNNSVTQIMKNNVGVNTITYDCNKDDISQLTDDKFDIILVRSVIGHIDNLEKFIKEIDTITSKDGVIILSFHIPSLQAAIVWGYDDYTFSCFYDPKYIQRLFEEKNFKLVKKYSETEDLVEKYYKNKRKGLLFIPLYYVYRFINYLNNFKKQNLQILDTQITMILKKS